MADTSTLGVAAAVALGIYLLRRLWRGPKPVEQIHRRGRTLRSAQEAHDLLSQRRRPFDAGLRLGCQLFPSEIATRHFAFIGTTGSGKTLLQRLLMQSALTSLGRGVGHRAVVYDAKQDTLAVLSGMKVGGEIHLLNPLDARAVGWDMAADIECPAAALQVANTLVPAAKNDANPFFANAARHLLYGALLALMERAPRRWSFRQALLLLREPVRLQALLSRTESTRHLLTYFAHPGTAQNIFATVLTTTSPFEIIAACWDRAGKSLSLADWLAGESILVLGNDEQNRAALDTINQLLFQRLAELVLAGPEVDDRVLTARRTWFFLDEVREAGRLDLLGRLLTKGRSKGVAVALGFQDLSGMREVYGAERAEELLGQCNTKVILRLNSPETAAWAAKLFGNREVLEKRLGHSRNRRVSLNREVSSGDSVSHAIAQQPLVLDSQIMDLPETTRENGIHAFLVNPLTGPFADHLEPAVLCRHLFPPDPRTQNFLPRPHAHQFLRPWSLADDVALGLDPSDATNESTEGDACE
ncbi:MAG: type IV secretory system conjugative DNA transfer family protein [Limisphaerales bacterium]